MHYTRSLSRLASTRGGMRRILKKQLPAVDYIKHAVETGVYKKIYFPDKNEQNVIPQRGGGRGGKHNRPQQQQQGGDSSFMPKINPYPSEYEILTLNPPLPMKPRLSKKDLRYLQREQREKERLAKAKEEGVEAAHRNPSSFEGRYDRLPTDKYVRDYMKRYDERMRSSISKLTDSQKEEAYYRSVLDVPALGSAGKNTKQSSTLDKATYEDKEEHDASFFIPKEMNNAMGRKPHVLSHAYDFALKQYEVLSENEGMSEEESIKRVEEILQQEQRDEMLQSRIQAQKIKEEMKMKRQHQQRQQGEEFDTSSTMASGSKSSTGATTTNVTPASTIPSILYSKPRTIQALTIWGQRLQAVPYNQWTLGATTALDHWIAVDVLGMKEDTWQRLLSGELESDVHESRGNDVVIGNMARTKDIITVRSTLFPETVAHMIEDEEEEAEIAAVSEEMGGLIGVDAEKEATERSIDELLASLGGMGESSGELSDEEERFAAQSEDEDLDSRIAVMVDSLQEWRKIHDVKPYDEWDEDKKKEFDNWFSDYLDLVTNESDGEVDITATRNALLSEPPISRDTSESFWSQVQDEADAEILLHEILERGTPTQPTASDVELPSIKKSREALEVFLALPYDQQLRQLVNMGTLRPILDEYYKESDRIKFMDRHGQTLLEGIEVEHLVTDPEGHITLKDIGDDKLAKEVEADTKFSIKKIPFGTDEYGMGRSEKARMLYRAWNMQKAGRARYAEAQFKQGKMPLREEQ